MIARVPMWVLPVAFAAIVAATIFGAVARTGSARMVCTIAGAEVTTDARHATETPAGWVVEAPRGVVVASTCRRD